MVGRLHPIGSARLDDSAGVVDQRGRDGARKRVGQVPFVVGALRPIAGASINTVLGEIRLPNGGHVDFWSVDHSQRAGRGRKYHLVLIDEAAHDEGYLTDAFPAAIAPTLLDYAGSVVEASTPNGVEPTNHFWQAAHLAELGFVTHHAPTSANPHLP